MSGALDRTPAGPHPFPPANTWGFTQHNPFQAVYETNRRSVYLMTQRMRRHPFLALFDGADPNASTAQRYTTTVPTQALFFLNDPFVHEQADQFAARLLQRAADDAGRIDLAHRLALRPAGDAGGDAGRRGVPAEVRAGVEGRRRRAGQADRGGVGELLLACCSPPTNSFTSIDRHGTTEPEGHRAKAIAVSCLLCASVVPFCR